MIDLKRASFHYSLAHLHQNSESLFYDVSSEVYRALPKQMPSSPGLQKLSVHDIIVQARRFCRCDDPQQFNLLLSKSFLRKLRKISTHVEYHLSKLSIICIIFNRIFNWVRLGRFLTTTEMLLETEDAVERHTYYLIGRKLSFTIFKSPQY